MDGGWGRFRTTDGDVSIGDDTIRIHRSPKKFLQGQLSRWRNGNRWQGVAAVGGIVVFLLVPLTVVSQLYRITELSVELALVFSVIALISSIVPFWARHLRETRIPLSAIEDITLDTDELELTITHDANSRLAVVGGNGDQQWFSSDDPFSIFERGETETSMTLRTADDVRKARSLFRTKGISDVDMSKPEETETEYRVDTRNGVVFCEHCGSQVSPSDRICPACDYALRVEQERTMEL